MELIKERINFKMKSNYHFTGPIFIVGMPRSGTKLLREILNNHSLIAIPDNESHFIPYLYDRLDKYGDLKNLNNFKHFSDSFLNAYLNRRCKISGPDYPAFFSSRINTSRPAVPGNISRGTMR